MMSHNLRTWKAWTYKGGNYDLRGKHEADCCPYGLMKGGIRLFISARKHDNKNKRPHVSLKGTYGRLSCLWITFGIFQDIFSAASNFLGVFSFLLWITLLITYCQYLQSLLCSQLILGNFFMKTILIILLFIMEIDYSILYFKFKN